MTTTAQALDAPEVRRPSWPQFLRDELAPTHGRLNATIRIVVGTAIVLATSMTLGVPSIGLSLFIVLFLTRLTATVSAQNSVAVAVAGIIAILVVTLAIALTILVYRFIVDLPPLRLAAMALFF